MKNHEIPGFSHTFKAWAWEDLENALKKLQNDEKYLKAWSQSGIHLTDGYIHLGM